MSFERQTFEALRGEEFTLHDGVGGTHELTLHSVDGDETSFALLFATEEASPLPQGTYELAHAKWGPHALFVVPVQPPPGQGGSFFEVVFG